MRASARKSHQLQSAFAGFTEQAVMGFKLLEEQAGDGWYVNNRSARPTSWPLSAIRRHLICPSRHVSAEKFPRLAALSERAMKIDAFASTVAAL